MSRKSCWGKIGGEDGTSWVVSSRCPWGPAPLAFSRWIRATISVGGRDHYMHGPKGIEAINELSRASMEGGEG